MLRGGPYESGNSVGMYEPKKVKRYRSAFTTSQINYLEKQFEKCPYIGSAARKEVANILNIPERAIKIWFQNRRMKNKKEVINADFNIEEHNNIANSMKFAKDSLINAHSSQSANDRPNSLQSNVAKHGDTTNFSPNFNNSTFCNQITTDDLKRETNDNQKVIKIKGGAVNNIKKEVGRPHLLQPNLMKHNLDTKYNNTNFINFLQLNSKSVTKSNVIPKTPKGDHFSDRTNAVTMQYQDLPEDLSGHTRNLPNVIAPQNYPTTVQIGPAYIPFCNTQDVCISAGNMMWKPVNVMPAMTTVPVALPGKQSSVSPTNVQGCKCSCNCHSSKNLNYDRVNKSSQQQPQYIIAIPYNNN